MSVENPFEKDSPRPGGELPKWNLYELRVDQATGEEKGVKTPDGTFYPFNNEEKFTQIKETEDGERLSFIIDKDGNQIPFEEWKLSQEK